MLAVDLSGNRIELTLRAWVNSGLMTFFFVLGLEVRREFDLGDFRERRRLVLPLVAAVGGMGAALATYVASTSGSRCDSPISCRTPTGSASTSCASRTTSTGTPGGTASPGTWRVRT